MNFKELMHTFYSKLKSWWNKGTFQKNSRITFDVFWNIILFFIIIGVVGLFFAGGVGAGYFASLVKDEEVRSRVEMEKDIYNYEETSELYFANNKYLGEVSSDLHREEIKLQQVSKYVKDAIIATEDETFETHNGVVPKAILRALVQEATNAPIKTGGSTLTQQLIKNQILTNEVSFERKAKEILLALRLEEFFDKDEILEAYLNIVPFGRDANGRNIAGIQTAAQGIFGVDANELNIAQAAFIAGLPQSPSYYTPFKNNGELKDESGLKPGLNRMQTVLSRMFNAGYITESDYQQAINYDIVANFTEPTPSVADEYPYLNNEIKKRAAKVLSDILAKQDGYTDEDLQNNETLREEYRILAQRNLTQSGYKIHTTIDKDLYDVFQKLAAEYNNYGPDRTETFEDPETGEKIDIVEPVQVGSILIENKTGKILSFVGGRDFEHEQTNHATDSYRDNGSTMKPILVYAPAMEAGVVQPGSVILDAHTVFDYKGWDPYNYTSRNYGLVSVREALYESYNVPVVKTYMKIRYDDPATQYLEKMGITSLTDADHENPSAALGQVDGGISVEENTNAFATFGNSGKFADAYMIEKIETKDGEVIFEHQTEEVEVFTPQTNYLMIDMMRDVITRGTAASARSYLSNPSVDWAGKTGTSNDWHDTWFVATNPNVSLGSWMGYDTPKQLSDGYSNRNVAFWSQLVNAAAEIYPDLITPSERFERPGGIVSRSYCAVSGMLPSDLCSELGLVKTDLFNANFVPNETDNSLIEANYVMVNDKAVLAGENTPDEFIQNDGITFNPEWLEQIDYIDQVDDLRELFPSNSGGWAKIAIPNTDNTEIDNDGKAPATPKSINKSGNKLTWNKSGSGDVVGYRVFRAANPDGASFKLIGSTTETEYTIPDSKAVYHVKAVDYFGQESAASETLVVGDFSKKPEEPEEPKEPEKPKDPENEGNGNDNGSDNRQNENSNGNGNNSNNSSNGDQQDGNSQ